MTRLYIHGCRSKYITPNSFKSLNKLVDLEARLGETYKNGFIVLGTSDANDDTLSPTFWDGLNKTEFEYRRPMGDTPVTVDGIATYINRCALVTEGRCGEEATKQRNENFEERSKLLNDISREIKNDPTLKTEDGSWYLDSKSLAKKLAKYENRGVGVITVHSDALKELDCVDGIDEAGSSKEEDTSAETGDTE